MMKKMVKAVQNIPYNAPLSKDELIQKYKLLQRIAESNNISISAYYDKLIEIEKGNINEKLFRK